MLMCSKYVCSFRQKVSFVHAFVCREPSVMCMNDQGLTNYRIAQTLAVEDFGGLVPINILADKTLADWLLCTVK